MQHSVFICYQHEDATFCHTVAKALRDSGFDVWYDNENAEWGQLPPTIEHEIEQRAIFVVLLSPKALQSRWVEDQCRWAFHHLHQPASGVQAIIPVLVKKIRRKKVWPMLRDFQRVAQNANKPFPMDEAISQTVHMAQAISDGVPISNARVNPDQQVESAAFLVAAGQQTRPKTPRNRRQNRRALAKSQDGSPRIYIAFQPKEALEAAGLAAHWQDELHESSIMLDQSRLVPPTRFQAEVLESAIKPCKIFLALLTRDAVQAARDPSNLFCKEVAFALHQRRVRVVPVLLDGYELPPPSELPIELHQLVNLVALRKDVMSLRAVYDDAIRGFMGRASLRAKTTIIDLL